MDRDEAIRHGFFWPSEMVLVNGNGETLTIRPIRIDERLDDQNRNRRYGQALRFYQTDLGEMSELAVFHWRVGGADTSLRFNRSLREFFESEQADEIPTQVVVDHMRNLGFDDDTFRIVERWLTQDDYMFRGPGSSGEGDVYRVLRW